MTFDEENTSQDNTHVFQFQLVIVSRLKSMLNAKKPTGGKIKSMVYETLYHNIKELNEFANSLKQNPGK